MVDRIKNWAGAIAFVTLVFVVLSSMSTQMRGAREPNPATGEIYRVHDRHFGTVYVTKEEHDSGYWLGGMAAVSLVTLVVLRLTGWNPKGKKPEI